MLGADLAELMTWLGENRSELKQAIWSFKVALLEIYCKSMILRGIVRLGSILLVCQEISIRLTYVVLYRGFLALKDSWQISLNKRFPSSFLNFL